jgi:hypothetical protein
MECQAKSITLPIIPSKWHKILHFVSEAEGEGFRDAHGNNA